MPRVHTGLSSSWRPDSDGQGSLALALGCSLHGLCRMGEVDGWVTTRDRGHLCDNSLSFPTSLDLGLQPEYPS